MLKTSDGFLTHEEYETFQGPLFESGPYYSVRAQALQAIGETALATITLPPDQEIATRLSATNTKSRWQREHFFPILARHGSEPISLISFVTMLRDEIADFRKRFGNTSPDLDEKRVTLYSNALLSDYPLEVRATVGALNIWFEERHKQQKEAAMERAEREKAGLSEEIQEIINKHKPSWAKK